MQSTPPSVRQLLFLLAISCWAGGRVEAQVCVDCAPPVTNDGTASCVGDPSCQRSRFDLASLADPSPHAAVGVSPAIAFPGDTVTATNTSSASFTRWALWLADQTGAIVAGSDQLSGSTPLSCAYAVPTSIAESASLTAYVAVENDDFPYNPASPGEQLASQVITVDRTPTAAIAMTPQLPITGDTVVLAASAEGHPDSYRWSIVTPIGVSCPSAYPTCTAGGPWIQVPLAGSGDWGFDLTADYLHTVGGALYQAIASLNRTVSSVAAAFSVSPAVPTDNQPITLTSTSNVASGVTPTYSWSVSGPSSYTGCPAAATCQIPAETLTPGLYTVQLTVGNPANSDSDSAFKPVNVAYWDPQLDFTWSPTSPAIGGPVIFTIQGASGITRADWDFGGPGCSGYAQVASCVPGQFTQCGAAMYRYATSGAKLITLEVEIDGILLPLLARTIIVGASGSCAQAVTIFSDDFETGGCLSWSEAVGQIPPP